MNASERLRELKAAPRERGEARFFFHDTHFASDAVKVLPGEYFVAAEPLLITTTLGSCIAVCLWDRVRRVGGLNHFMLPDGGDGGGGDASGRYGGFAMELLINAMMKRGAARGALEAKVFGGGQVVGGMSSLNVGQRNAQFALDYLRAERVAVLAQDVGDIYPRKVCFLPQSGKAMVKRLASGHHESLLAQERAAAQAAAPAVGGSVDLF
jgi:chemotaxis protein CheD